MPTRERFLLRQGYGGTSRVGVSEAVSTQAKSKLARSGSSTAQQPSESGSRSSANRLDCRRFLTKRYLELAAVKASIVVVSQTWSEIQKVNEGVREGLKRGKLIETDETLVSSLQRIDLTDAQKRDGRYYSEKTVVVLNRDAGGLRRGDQCRMIQIGEDSLIVEMPGKIRRIPFKHLDRVSVCEPKDVALAAGDRLQLKANGKTADGKLIANGEIVTVSKVEADGRIRLQDGRVLEKNYRQFVRGYAVTSYAAQGKTADHVIFADSAIKAATNQKQWYVTISRGRKGVEIFTTDKRELRENVIRSGDRELALELTAKMSAKQLTGIQARKQIRKRGIRA